MHGESRYHNRRAGYRYADEDEECWFGAMTIHVLAYVRRLPRLAGSDLARQSGYRAEQVLGGRAACWLPLTASLLTGLLLAAITVHLAGPWTAVPGLGR